MSEISAETDPELVVNRVYNVLNEIIRNSSAEVKMGSKDVPFDPWMSRSILRSIETSDKLWQRVKVCPRDTFARKTFNAYRNKLRECLREAERRHIEKSLKAAGDPVACCSMWHDVFSPSQFE